MVLQGCSDFAMAYLEDIIIFSKNEEEHLKLKEAGLKLKESKCVSLKRRSITWVILFEIREYTPYLKSWIQNITCLNLETLRR